MVNPAWSGVVTSSAEARLHNHQVHMIEKQDLFLGSSPINYKEGKQQLAFLQGDNPAFNNHNQNPPLSVAVSQTLLRNSPLSESGGIRSKMFCDSLTSEPVHDSHCALSLLSSPQTHTPGNGNGLNLMVQQPHSSISLMQPLGLSLHDHSLESVDPVLVPNGSATNVHGPPIYNMGSDGSQGGEPPQPFPFHWE